MPGDHARQSTGQPPVGQSDMNVSVCQSGWERWLPVGVCLRKERSRDFFDTIRVLKETKSSLFSCA